VGHQPPSGGIHWGLRLIEKDLELHGPVECAVFVLVTDGEAWSGEVEKSPERRSMHAPVLCGGCRHLAGGRMPAWVPKNPNDEVDRDAAHLARPPGFAAHRLGGRRAVCELDRDGDRHIANTIVDAAKRALPAIGVTEQAEELYWRFLVIAALFVVAGLLFLHERSAGSSGRRRDRARFSVDDYRLTPLPLLSVDRVVRTYPRVRRSVTAVDHVSLTLEAGDFVALVGPSGCGRRCCTSAEPWTGRPLGPSSRRHAAGTV
jgi:hypothetical protein